MTKSKKPEDLRSHRWLGVQDLRAFGHRSRLRQMGYDDGDWGKRPIIGIINTWSDINSCHAHLRERAQDVKRGILQSGGFPLEMPAISLAEPFQKPSTMLYRNLLAMETEELLRSYPIDGAILLGGCDKTTPGLVMGAISMGLPFIFCPAGPMLRGNWKGQALGSGSDVWKYWDEKRAGKITEAEWEQMENGIARSFGTCMTMGTAVSMMSVAEALGLTLPGAALIPAADANHPRMMTHAGRRVVDMVWEDMTPDKIVTAKAVDNAIRVHMALGGSTNVMIHLIAMARRAGVALSLERFDQISREVPVIANIRPSGAYLAEDFFYAGGLACPDEGTRAADPRRLHDGERRDHGRNDRAGGGLQHRRHPQPQEPDLRRGRDGRVEGQPRAARRHHEALGSRGAPAQASRQGGGVPRLQPHGGGDRPRRPRRDRGFGDRAAERGSEGRSGHAGVGHAADPEEAREGRACGTWCASPTPACRAPATAPASCMSRRRVSSAARWRWCRPATISRSISRSA